MSAQGLLTDAPLDCVIRNCTFKELNVALEVVGTPMVGGAPIYSTVPRLYDTDFSENEYNIYLHRTNGIRMQNCVLNGGRVGLFAFDVNEITLVGGEVKSYPVPQISDSTNEDLLGAKGAIVLDRVTSCLLYTSPSPRDPE